MNEICTLCKAVSCIPVSVVYHDPFSFSFGRVLPCKGLISLFLCFGSRELKGTRKLLNHASLYHSFSSMCPFCFYYVLCVHRTFSRAIGISIQIPVPTLWQNAPWSCSKKKDLLVSHQVDKCLVHRGSLGRVRIPSPFHKANKNKKNIPKVHHRRLSRVFWNTTCPLMPSLNYAPYALNTHWRQRQWARAGNHNSGVNHVIVHSASISTSMTTFRRRGDFFTHSPVTWQWCQAYRKPHNHALLCFCTAMYSYMHPVFWKSNLGV